MISVQTLPLALVSIALLYRRSNVRHVFALCNCGWTSVFFREFNNFAPAISEFFRQIELKLCTPQMSADFFSSNCLRNSHAICKCDDAPLSKNYVKLADRQTQPMIWVVEIFANSQHSLSFRQKFREIGGQSSKALFFQPTSSH